MEYAVLGVPIDLCVVLQTLKPRERTGVLRPPFISGVVGEK